MYLIFLHLRDSGGFKTNVKKKKNEDFLDLQYNSYSNDF